MLANSKSTSVPWVRSNGVGAVSIVASAGGIPALIEIFRGTSSGLAFPILIAQHLSRSGPSILPSVLSSHTGCVAKWAEQGEEPEAGVVYLAPPRCGLEIRQGRLVLPALPDDARAWLKVPDQLLSSLAKWCGSEAIAVMLSGMLPAGISGLRAIRKAGGVSMAQNESSSPHFEMPMAAADLGKVDIIFSPRQIGRALNILSEQRLRAQ